jgi:hypothetical protein
LAREHTRRTIVRSSIPNGTPATSSPSGNPVALRRHSLRCANRVRLDRRHQLQSIAWPTAWFFLPHPASRDEGQRKRQPDKMRKQLVKTCRTRKFSNGNALGCLNSFSIVLVRCSFQ